MSIVKSLAINALNASDYEEKRWYLNDHLLEVERIATALIDQCAVAVDLELVEALIWLHDLPKIIGGRGNKDNFQGIVRPIVDALFPDRADEVFEELLLFEKMKFLGNAERDLASIEVRIASSADAISHYTCGFLTRFQEDHPGMPIGELAASNAAKLGRDKDKCSSEYVSLIADIQLEYTNSQTVVVGATDLVARLCL